MILYTYSDPKGQIFNLLEADVKSISHFEMPDERDCTWRIITHEGDDYSALDIVRMEIDGSGIPQTGIIVDETDPHYAFLDVKMQLEDKEMGLRTFRDGDIVFYQGSSFEEIEDPLLRARYKLHDNQDCIIQSLETYVELGDKDFEYYNIKFYDGFKINNISGHYLTKTS